MIDDSLLSDAARQTLNDLGLSSVEFWQRFCFTPSAANNDLPDPRPENAAMCSAIQAAYRPGKGIE